MNTLEKKVLETIRKNNLVEDGDKLILGVSGGPDSMCMLRALMNIFRNYQGGVSPVAKNCQQGPSPVAKNCQQGPSPVAKNCQQGPSPMAKNCQEGPSPVAKIVVAHVNHMIREEAKADEEYVRSFCSKNGIEFYSKSIDVQKIANNSKIGVEEAGRNARYEFFDEILNKTGANKIAIAHNKNDKAETMIMKIVRGTGISGLKGIDAKRERYIRPLIDCERKEIEEYCEQNKLNPRIDKSNFENEYTRNKIRNIVIPYIKEEFNPNIIETLNRLSELVSEEEEYIEKQVRNTYGDLALEETDNQIVLKLKEFNNQEKVIKSRLVLYTITRLFNTSKGIEKIHIEDIIKLCGNNIGNKFLTPNKKIKILVKNHKIYFIKQI